MDSILVTLKTALNIEEDDDAFDQELIMYINGELIVMNELGIGPESGFVITGPSETWIEFLGSENYERLLSLVKTDMYLRVRLTFDPYQTGHMNEKMKEQIKEYDHRIVMQHERGMRIYGKNYVYQSA